MLFVGESGHVHTTERLTLTGHLWYAHGAAAGAVAPFGQSFDLDQVVLSRGDVQLHTGLIGFPHSGHCVPVLTIQNLQEGADAVGRRQKKRKNNMETGDFPCRRGVVPLKNRTRGFLQNHLCSQDRHTECGQSVIHRRAAR